MMPDRSPDVHDRPLQSTIRSGVDLWVDMEIAGIAERLCASMADGVNPSIRTRDVSYRISERRQFEAAGVLCRSLRYELRSMQHRGVICVPKLLVRQPWGLACSRAAQPLPTGEAGAAEARIDRPALAGTFMMPGQTAASNSRLAGYPTRALP